MTVGATRYRNRKGQALTEFVLLAPLMVILLYGIFNLGWAMLVGSNAASAVEEPVMQKLALADIPGNASARALTLIQGYAPGAIPTRGGPVDGSNTQFANNVTAILTANKLFVTSIPFLPDLNFNFAVTQPINGNLLLANNDAGQTGSAGTPGLGTVGVQPYSQSLAGGGTVNPADYGIGLSDVPPTITMNNPNCNPSISINLATVNAAGSNDYTLAQFADASTSPAAGGFNTSYNAPSIVLNPSGLLAWPNQACDSADSIANFSTGCQAELVALTPTTNEEPDKTDTTTLVTTQTTTATNTPATGKTTTTTVTTYPATALNPPPASPETTLGNTTTTVVLNATTGITTQTVSVVSETPPPAGTGTGNVANPNAFVSTCVTKKQQSCRLQWANQYLTSVLAAMAAGGGCASRTLGNGADITFSPTSQPY
jgi:hypothetical protein